MERSSVLCPGATLDEEEAPGGVDRKRHRRNKEEGRAKKKPKAGKVVNKPMEEAMLATDAKEKGKERGGKKKKKTWVTWTLSQELIGYLHTKEIMGFIATDTPRPLWPGVGEELFGPELKQEIAAEFNKNREFEADVLYEYRTSGYVLIQEEIVVGEDDDDEEEVFSARFLPHNCKPPPATTNLATLGEDSPSGICHRKRHRKKEGRRKKKKPKGGEVAKKPMEEMPASNKEEKGGKRRKMLMLRSPPYFQVSLETEIMCYMLYEPRSTPLEMHVFGVGIELQEAAACILKEVEFRADLYRQYRINGYADLQLEVPDDDDVHSRDRHQRERPAEEEEDEATGELEARDEENHLLVSFAGTSDG